MYENIEYVHILLASCNTLVSLLTYLSTERRMSVSKLCAIKTRYHSIPRVHTTYITRDPHCRTRVNGECSVAGHVVPGRM